MSIDFESKEFDIYTDENTGQRYDARGNPITAPSRRQGLNDIAYYSATGQGFTYAQVFHGAKGHVSETAAYADVYPGPTNVHQNQALTNFAVRFELDESMFIAPLVNPILTVDKRSDIFYKVASQGADVTRTPTDNTDVWAIGATANEVQQGFDTDTYTSTNRGLRDFIPDKVAANADQALDLMTSKTRFLTQMLLYRWDARFLTNIFSTSNFNNATFATAGGGQVGAATTALRYINLAFNYANNKIRQQNLMGSATHVVMNSDVAQRIAASPETAGQIVYALPDYQRQGGYTNGQKGNYGLPSELYGCKPVVVPHIYNSAKKGQTASFSDILTDNLLFIHVEQPSIMTRNTSTTFRVGGLQVRTYRDEGRMGTYVEVSIDQAEKITNSNGGYILTDALA